MTIKQTEKNTNKSGWKGIVQGFVENILDQVGENVSQRIHEGLLLLRRKTIGSVLMMLGLVYLIVGLCVFLNSVLAVIAPGLGYMVVGIVAALVGYLINSDEVK